MKHTLSVLLWRLLANKITMACAPWLVQKLPVTPNHILSDLSWLVQHGLVSKKTATLLSERPWVSRLCCSVGHVAQRLHFFLRDIPGELRFFSRHWQSCLLAVSLLALTSCYQLGEIRPTVLRNVQTLAIPTFRNATLYPRVEVLLADITARMFQSDGTYEIVQEKEADAILECKLVSVSRQPILSSTTNVLTTTQFQLQIKVDYQVIDRITGSILQVGSINGSTTYYVGVDLISDERQVFPIAAQTMASSLVIQLTQGW